MPINVTYIDPNADGTAADWAFSSGSVSYALVDDAVRQPTAPSVASDFLSTGQVTRNVDFAFPDTATYASENSYVLWVYGSTSGEVNRGIYYAVSTDNGSNWSASTLLLDANLSARWASADISSFINSQAKLNGLQIRIIHAVTGGSSSGTATVYALYVEQDQPVTGRVAWTEIQSQRNQAAYGARITTQADSFASWDARLTTSPHIFAEGFEGPISPYDALVLSNSPVAYWKFNQTSGTSAVDSAGTNTGTYTGGYTLAQQGIMQYYGVQFDGVNGYVSVPDAAALDLADGPFTLEAWIRKTSSNATGYIFSKGANYLFSLTPSGFLEFYPGTTPRIAHSTVAITDTTISHHVVVSKNGSAIKIYLDSVDVTSTSGDTNTTLTSNASVLGIGGWSGGNSLPAVVTNAAIYNSVLTDDQVAAHFSAGTYARQNFWVGNNATISRDTAQAQQGTRSLKVVTNNAVITEGTSLSLSPPPSASVLVPVIPGSLLTLSARIYAQSGGYNLRILVDEYNSSFALQGTSTTYFTPPATTWTQYTVQRVLGGSAAYVNLRVLTSNLNSTPTAATFWIDDVTVDQIAFSSSTQDVAITGQATDSRILDARVTGDVLRARIAWAEIETAHISNPASTTQDVRLTGQATTSRTLDARITSRDSTSYTQDVRLTSQDSTNQTYAARLTAAALAVTDNTTQDVRLTSQATTNVTYVTKLTGQATTAQAWDTRITGKLTSNVTYDVRTAGQATSNVVYDGRATGQLTSNYTQDIRTVGSLVSNVAYDARQIGLGIPSYSQDAFITGQQDVEVAYDTRLTGQELSSVAYDTRLVGSDTTSLAQDARLSSAAIDSIAHDARQIGRLTDNVTFDAFITGQVIGTDRGARIYYAEFSVPASDAITDEVEFDARLQAIGQIDAAYDARITSGTTADVAFDARLTGQESDQLGVAARIVGSALSSIENVARLVGAGIAQLSPEARITGGLASSRTLDARLFGIAIPVRTLDARITGRDTTSRANDARITGIFPTSTTDNQIIVTWAEMSVPNPMGSDVSYDARIGGQAESSFDFDVRLLSLGTDNVSLGAFVTAQSESIVDYFALITGSGVDNTTFDVRLSSLDNPFTEIDARLTSVNTDEIAYDARIFGVELQNVEYDARLSAQASDFYVQDACVTALLQQSQRTQDVALTSVGVPNNAEYDIRLSASESSSANYDARTFGLGLTTADYDSRVTAQATSSAAFDARVTGLAVNALALTARLTGRALDSLIQDVRLTARASNSLEFYVHLIAQSGPVVVYDARLTARATNATILDARLSGQLSNSVSYNGRITARELSNVAYDAAISGRAQSFAAYDARLISAGIAQREVDANLIGATLSTIDVQAFVNAAALHNTERDANLIGVAIDFLEIGAYITSEIGVDAYTQSVFIAGRNYHPPIQYEEAKLVRGGDRTILRVPREGTGIKRYPTNINL